MIELAPGDKQGLPVENPVLIAGGMVGFGEAVPRGLDLSRVGGVVIGPFTPQPRAGRPAPRLAEGLGGFVLDTGGQARGTSAAIKKFGALWPRLGCPVVAQIAGESAYDVGKMATRLCAVPGLAGLEIVPMTEDVDEARRMVRNAVRAGDLPVWAKPVLTNAQAWAEALIAGGARGLVIGQAPHGTLAHTSGELISGQLYGAGVFALMIEALVQVAALKLPCSLIACGGIHTAAQMATALGAGAHAVQVDTGLWVEPSLPTWLVGAWVAQKST